MKIFKNINDSEIAMLLIGGDIGIIPTDTVYGFACKADNPTATKLLYDTKRKHETKPGTIIAANVSQLIDLGFDRNELKFALEILNAGVSVIMKINAHRSYLNFGINTQAARIIVTGNLHDLLKITGPLITSSANKPGQEPIKSIEQGKDIFGEEISFYVDGGYINSRPSTILKINKGKVELVRNGSVDVSKFLKQNLR